MAADGFGDFFITDDEGGQPVAPAVPPSAPQQTGAPQPQPAPAPAAEPAAPQPMPVIPSAPAPAPQPAPAVPAQQAPAAPQVAPSPQPAAPVPQPAAPAPTAVPAPAVASRETRLASALDHLMAESLEIEAAALVSLDGFTMASALPEGMHEDRVGAMSAAILGLGERAAAELGRGKLSQVFIEGEGGFVLLMAAGSGAVLTCLAGPEAKLGLVLYDMRTTADEIAEILV